MPSDKTQFQTVKWKEEQEKGELEEEVFWFPTVAQTWQVPSYPTLFSPVPYRDSTHGKTITGT